ncbi:MAG: hypothetical protein H6737_27875 [Alphaproteobacteria bacterium]|nr:hypothetical protein [Alphaproteobacteria bacterium]
MWWLALLACTSAPVETKPEAAPRAPPDCYARAGTDALKDPCATCHGDARPSGFRDVARENPWTNLFALRVYTTSDADLDAWVRTSNAPDAVWDARFDGDSDGWRTYRAQPFPGFFMTNGTVGETRIRLPPAYRPDAETYAVNLAVLEAMVRRGDVPLAADEARWGVDLDGDGAIGAATRVAFRETGLRWVGDAPGVPTPGGFPEGTQLLQVLRYLDPAPPVRMAARIREVRLMERSATGWRFAGRIEDAEGALRPQSDAEIAMCGGCHGALPVTTDGVFSFGRRTAWGGDLTAVGGPDRTMADGRGEYTAWLEQTGAGDTLGVNAEARAKFFGEGRELSFEDLARDIRVLTLPSADRARELNRVWRAIAEEQSYARGREPVAALGDEQVWREIPPH